jgi:lipopolysaccharide transport system permease protein
MKRLLLSLWNYRHFIVGSVKNEFRTRFIRSRLGAAWIVLHPLAQVLIYALVLSQVMQAKLPGVDSQYAYPIYLLSGMVVWSLFAELLGRLLTVFIENANLLKKLAFPKLALPLVSIGSSMVNFTLLLLAMYLVFAFLGHFPFRYILWLVPLISITLVLAVGIGLTLGILNVFVRDIGQVLTIVLQFWFWLTPIVYTIDIVPQKYRFLLHLNPLSSIVEGFQSVLVYERSPDILPMLYPALFGLFMLGAGMWLFLRAKEEITDVL